MCQIFTFDLFYLGCISQIDSLIFYNLGLSSTRLVVWDQILNVKFDSLSTLYFTRIVLYIIDAGDTFFHSHVREILAPILNNALMSHR